MCTELHQFRPAIQAAKSERTEVLARMFAHLNILALIRRWRPAAALQR